MRTRRRYRWGQIANMARSASGAWRLHPDLAAVTLDLLHHARRRVRDLQPTPEGVFEFGRGNVGQNDLGRTVFDLYVRFVTTEGEHRD